MPPVNHSHVMGPDPFQITKPRQTSEDVDWKQSGRDLRGVGGEMFPALSLFYPIPSAVCANDQALMSSATIELSKVVRLMDDNGLESAVFWRTG